jgi:hypothetical protein
MTSDYRRWLAFIAVAVLIGIVTSLEFMSLARADERQNTAGVLILEHGVARKLYGRNKSIPVLAEDGHPTNRAVEAGLPLFVFEEREKLALVNRLPAEAQARGDRFWVAKADCIEWPTREFWYPRTRADRDETGRPAYPLDQCYLDLLLERAVGKRLSGFTTTKFIGWPALDVALDGASATLVCNLLDMDGTVTQVDVTNSTQFSAYILFTNSELMDAVRQMYALASSVDNHINKPISSLVTGQQLRLAREQLAVDFLDLTEVDSAINYFEAAPSEDQKRRRLGEHQDRINAWLIREESWIESVQDSSWKYTVTGTAITDKTPEGEVVTTKPLESVIYLVPALRLPAGTLQHIRSSAKPVVATR